MDKDLGLLQHTAMERTCRNTRMAQWRAQLCATYVQLESQSDDENFYGIIGAPVPGTNRLSTVTSTRQLTERTPALIRRDPQDSVLLILQHSGTGFFEQDDRQVRLMRGDFTLCDTTRPYRLKFDTPFTQIDLRLSRRALQAALPGFAHTTGRRFDGNQGAALVLSGFIRQLYQDGARLSAPILENFQDSILRMLETTITLSGAQRDGDAWLWLQKRLRRNVKDPDLTPKDLARSAGMSLRSLQRACQSAGTTPRGWLLEQRLTGIARDLRNPAYARHAITDIAFAWGFRDLSHFSRSFHTRFGCSARSWRKAGA